MSCAEIALSTSGGIYLLGASPCVLLKTEKNNAHSNSDHAIGSNKRQMVMMTMVFTVKLKLEPLCHN